MRGFLVASVCRMSAREHIVLAKQVGTKIIDCVHRRKRRCSVSDFHTDPLAEKSRISHCIKVYDGFLNAAGFGNKPKRTIVNVWCADPQNNNRLRRHLLETA